MISPHQSWEVYVTTGPFICMHLFLLSGCINSPRLWRWIVVTVLVKHEISAREEYFTSLKCVLTFHNDVYGQWCWPKPSFCWHTYKFSCVFPLGSQYTQISTQNRLSFQGLNFYLKTYLSILYFQNSFWNNTYFMINILMV